MVVSQQVAHVPHAPQHPQTEEAVSPLQPVKDTACSLLITTWKGVSARQPWGTGVNVAPALTLARAGPAALHLFITLCRVSPPLHLPSHPLQSWHHYSRLLIFTPLVQEETWIKVTAGAAEMTESACLQGHLSPSPLICDMSCPLLCFACLLYLQLLPQNTSLGSLFQYVILIMRIFLSVSSCRADRFKNSATKQIFSIWTFQVIPHCKTAL